MSMNHISDNAANFNLLLFTYLPKFQWKDNTGTFILMISKHKQSRVTGAPIWSDIRRNTVGIFGALDWLSLIDWLAEGAKFTES